jgi:plasmid stability protein
MKNITVSMEDELAARTRIAAARAGKSVSKYLAETLRDKFAAEEGRPDDRNLELEAIRRFLAGPPLNISENGRMPSADERNSRGWQRDIR